MKKNNTYKMELLIEKISHLFLKPDAHENITTKCLRNTEIPFKNFTLDLPKLLTREETIFVKETKASLETYKLRIEYINHKLLTRDYHESYFTKTPYEIGVSVRISIIRIKEASDVNTSEVLSTTEFPHQEIRIPELVTSTYNNLGGYFIVNRGLTKYVTLRLEQTSTWPKYRYKKGNSDIYHISINSNHLSFSNINEKQHPPQYLTVDISLIPDKIKCTINSKNSFVEIDLILLIHYLTNMKIDNIYEAVVSKFEKTSDIVYIMNILIENSKNILEDHKNIDEYVKYTILQKYNTFKKKPSTESEFRTNMLNTFLPHMIDTESPEKRGYYLMMVLKQFMVAITQPDVYPSKDNLSTRRVSTVADVFENIIKTAVDNSFKIFRDNYVQDINNLLIQSTILPQITLAFNNVFNMQDTRTSEVIKPAKHTNYFETVTVCTSVVRGKSIELTKSLDARELNESYINALDIYDTPDGGPNTGLVRRLNIGCYISHYDIETRKQTFTDIKNFILSYISDNKIDVINGVSISIVEESDIYITSLANEYIEDFITKFKNAKKNNVFAVNDVGIEAVPIHAFDNIKKIYVPTKNYLQIRFNIGNKRILKPVFVIENGIPVIQNYIDKILNDNIDSFSLLLRKYPNIIEIIDMSQIAYSNICSLTKFKNYSIDQRKLFNYIDFPNYMNFSYLTSCLFDISKSPGVRTTFGVAQQKQIITEAKENFFNSSDNCSILSQPEKPIITNSAIDLSGLNRRGRGKHLLVANISWNMNIEDGLIVNSETIETGRLSIITLTTTSAEIQDIKINNHNPNSENSNNSYEKINEHGLPDIGTVLCNTKDKKDALFRCVKMSYSDNTNRNYLFDQSEGYQHIYPGIVESTRKLGSDKISVSITTSSYRKATVGDKLTNGHAQKGTITKIIDYNKMPYLSSGERPDIIYNSISIISRKTLPMFCESMLSKLFSEIPFNEDGTIRRIDYKTYVDASLVDIKNAVTKELKKKYPNKSEEELINMSACKEDLFNPETNTKIITPSYVAPNMIMRLAQTSYDKISARNRGKLDKLGQPPSGKKKGGGIKYGEMEVDVLCTHESPKLLHEILSDTIEKRLEGRMCSNCGTFATYESTNRYSRWKCLLCEEMGFSPKINAIELTYATKLFLINLQTRGIASIPVEEKKDLYYPSLID